MTYEEFCRLRAEGHAKGTEIGCIEATITGIPSGLIDRTAERLFPWLYPDPPEGQACAGPCYDHDHLAAETEAEAGG